MKGPVRQLFMTDGHTCSPGMRTGLADSEIPMCEAMTSASGTSDLFASICDRVESLEIVTHRPQRRIVLRVKGVQNGRRVCRYVKGLRERSWERALQAYEGARAAGLQEHVAMPCGVVEALCALVFEAVEGPSLHGIGRARASLDTRTITTLLDHFAGANANAAALLPSRDLEDERCSTLMMLERGSAFVPGLDRLHARVSAWELPDCRRSQGFVHGDLHDKQIFAGALRVIDLDGAAWGSPWIDRANLLEHVRLRVLQGVWSRRWAARLWRALDTPGAPPEFGAARRLTQARLAGVYAQRPRWLDLARLLAASREPSDRRAP